MRTMQDSSELREAVTLLCGLVAEQERGEPTTETDEPPEAWSHEPFVYPPGPEPAVAEGTGFDDPEPFSLPTTAGGYRADRLDEALVALCRRGGFHGAVLADEAGLPLAVHNSPVEVEVLGAFAAVLGEALNTASRFLDRRGAEYISMDVDYAQKAALRRFSVATQQLYLMVLCDQGIDERSELELAANEIPEILG